MPIFLLIFIGLEIGVLIKLAGVFGSGLTVIWLLFAFLLGLALVRSAGFAISRQFLASVSGGISPAAAISDGMIRVLAGLLLIFPGILTDVLAILILIPPLRKLLFRLAVAREGLRASSSTVSESGSTGRPNSNRSGTILEGEARRVDDKS